MDLRNPFTAHPATVSETYGEHLRFASATAALKCTRFGGAFGSPQRAEVEGFLASNPADIPA